MLDELRFVKSLDDVDDPWPCGICKAIRETYYEGGERSYCEAGDASHCLDKDKALIKLIYHLLVESSH